MNISQHYSKHVYTLRKKSFPPALKILLIREEYETNNITFILRT